MPELEYKSLAAEHLAPKAPVTGIGDKCEIHYTTPAGSTGHGQPMSLPAAQKAVQTSEAKLAKAGKYGVSHTIKCTP